MCGSLAATLRGLQRQAQGREAPLMQMPAICNVDGNVGACPVCLVEAMCVCGGMPQLRAERALKQDHWAAPSWH